MTLSQLLLYSDCLLELKPDMLEIWHRRVCVNVAAVQQLPFELKPDMLEIWHRLVCVNVAAVPHLPIRVEA